MDAQNFWFSSGAAGGGGGGGGDEGRAIANSLRFRGDQWLQRTFDSAGSQTNFTISVWFKKAVPTDAESISFLAAGTLGSGTGATRDQFDIEMEQFFRFFGSDQNIPDSNEVLLRDPSAWYHVVISCDMSSATSTDRIRVFYNGQRQASLNCPITSFNFFNTAVEHRIGTEGIGVWTEGYYADYYFIDGQTLEPTAFGRENTQGIWVPREVDFTPATMRFSDFLTCAPGNFNVDSPATTAFDGDNTTFAEGTNTGDVLTFAPVPGIAYNSLEIAVRNDDQLFSLNGGANTSIANNRTTPTFVEIDSTPGTLDTLVIEGAAGEPGSLWAVRITDDNGTRELTNPFLWSADLTTNTSFSAAAANTFDGDTGEFCNATDGGSPTTVTFAPSTTIEGITSLEVWRAGGTGYSATFGGTTTNLNNEDAWNTVNLGTSTELSETSTLVVSRTSGAVALSAIRVNGQILQNGVNNSYGANGFHLDFSDPNNIGADRSGNENDWTASNGFELADDDDPDYDHMTDSPTQNFATVNPLALDEPGRADIIEANLRVDSSSNGTWAALSTQLNQDHFYFEVTMPVNNPSAAGTGTIVGVARVTQFPADVGWTNNSVHWVSQDVLNDFGTSTSNWAGTTYGTAGDVIGIEYDRANTRVRFWLNGTLEGTVTNAELDDGQFSPLIRHASSTAQSEYVYNFGQRPFEHRPAGLGDDTELQTQNLPTPTILNGSDQFRALTGTGANILGIAQGTNNNGTNWNNDVNTGFTNGFWWIKDRDNDNNHQLVDSVRGQDGGDWQAIWSNSNRNQQDYAAPTGNSVAWCWNAPDTWASTDADVTAGTIASNGRRNVAAGFSIVEYTGAGAPATSNNGTVAHGLSEAPEFVIYKNYSEDVVDIPVYHSGLTAGSNLFLNGTNSQSNTSKFPNPPDANFLRIGSVNDINGSGDSFIAYCWHSVAGYSAFGSYNGNGNASGPMIWTGFRPAFVLIKCFGATHPWIINDSTRDTTNPCSRDLFPNTDSSTFTGGGNEIDFLSNGFKLRNSNLTTNTTQPYIYAAFAENPFGGENTAPVNAR